MNQQRRLKTNNKPRKNIEENPRLWQDKGSMGGGEQACKMLPRTNQVRNEVHSFDSRR